MKKEIKKVSPPFKRCKRCLTLNSIEVSVCLECGFRKLTEHYFEDFVVIDRQERFKDYIRDKDLPKEEEQKNEQNTTN